ncbi:hypothetical protein [Streptomyces sp. NBC_01500]|uniref:hypothetical protein n=1 Tax=Streptomyces sp. NBC_01500 TaxID=2903886 RepID=UPI002254F2D8|nr:hypothetical protein [Streptomyces sp. NBC_01500]MCX4547265.1 hypothetical protein [Streptomyces sp. NBC_01500]MCX4554185.1 hypothetical protein [Streptomyces sp. NBC_01500]MCX4554525.1 hypothetical protein [Streptomyces sp. NBC_01500]
MATYTDGQKVQFNGMVMPATIISGPHPTHGADRWLIRKADETVSLVKVAELSPLLTKRDAAAKVMYESQMGRRWETASSYGRSAWLRMADKVLAALEVADADEKARPLTTGDRIRITRTGLEFASVTAGDVLTVMTVSDRNFTTNDLGSPSLTGRWSFALTNEGKGWERA